MNDLIKDFIEKNVIDSLQTLLATNDEGEIRKTASVVASQFGSGFDISTSESVQKLIISFKKNLTLLIQKTWVDSADISLKEEILVKLEKYCASIEEGEWSETDYNVHMQPLLAFASKAYTKRLRLRLTKQIEGQEPQARTACCAAVAGTTTPATAAPRPAAGFPWASAASTWASASLSLPVTEWRSVLSLSKESGAKEARAATGSVPHGVRVRGAKARATRAPDDFALDNGEENMVNSFS